MKMATKVLEKTDQPQAANVNYHTFTPKVDIWETEAGYHIEVEMPGVEKEGVDVKLEKGVLSILGRVQAEDTLGFEKVYSEYEFGNYERQFQISEIIDETKVKAVIKNGILQVELPKRESAKPKRIEVKVA
jgi:HSP20 family molecular chaperone IbpA